MSLLAPTTQHRTTEYKLRLQSLDEIRQFCQIALESKLVPPQLDNWQKIFIVIQYGSELGLEPMQAINGIAVINNRPMLFGDTLLALCMASGEFDHSVFDEHPVGEPGTDSYGWLCVAGRKGRRQPVRRTFTVAMAKRAGLLVKELWSKYLDRMLQMRARAWALRDLFPDKLRGLAIKEEWDGAEELCGDTTTAQSVLPDISSDIDSGRQATANELLGEPPQVDASEAVAANQSIQQEDEHTSGLGKRTSRRVDHARRKNTETLNAILASLERQDDGQTASA